MSGADQACGEAELNNLATISCTLSDQELAAKADQLIDELIKSGGKSFVMNIPARPNDDTDLIFAELNNRFKKLVTQPKPAGAVWVKGEYDRLYDQLKADVNCRIVCYIDYNTRTKNPDGSPYVLRDICSIWGENMEFGSRGIGYGSVRFMPGDYKENFIELCKQMNVEWLDESSTAAIQYESVFVPCAEDDPSVSGGYTSNDGRSLCYVKEVLATIKK